MTVNFEWTGMLEWTKVLKRGVIGPCLNHWANGKTTSSEHPNEYFCQRLSSSSQVRETPSSNSPRLYVAHRIT